MDLDKTTKVDLNRASDNEHTDVGMIAKRKREHTVKKKIMGNSKIGESTVSASDSHINAEQTLVGHSLSAIEDVIITTGPIVGLQLHPEKGKQTK